VWSRDFFDKNISRRSKARVRPEEILKLKPKTNNLLPSEMTIKIGTQRAAIITKGKL
jgi:hypothetical protein